MTPLNALEQRRNSKNLARAIFAADVPEQYIRTIPAQSIYLAIKDAGLASSGDLIGIATTEQVRLLLDFDLWHHDRFNEDNFWEWLALTDDSNDMHLLQKVIKSVDLKIVSLLIGKYVHAVTFDEPTEHPPGAGYFTPDMGYTWLQLNISDSHRHFLLGRMLALIFETSAELLYQLLGVQGVATESGLEEEAFLERNKRLLAEGIPDLEYAHQLNAPISEHEIERNLDKGKRTIQPRDISSVEPFVYDRLTLEPLTTLLASGKEGLEEELTLLVNAAIVRYGVDFSNFDQVSLMVSKVRGALNIGLEIALQYNKSLDALALYEMLGLEKLYRLGLTRLGELRAAARKVKTIAGDQPDQDPTAGAILTGARELFPEAPNFLTAEAVIDSPDGKLIPGYRAIETLRDLNGITELISRMKS